ncbi:Hypp8830 [Branchiostoma lanceolatum]|uniref:Hypp8830 protein n=1 Tax=Branchiostoma lanceolatum TaxID=7740 RepID=A0A8J9ZAC9_BRALA|nr:Hypp8830 [Branchiostoma lanceolatum]
MKHFVGTWKLSKVDFDQMKKFYTSMGMPAAAMEGQKEQWANLKVEVTENGTMWKGEFKMEGSAVTTELSFGGDKKIQTTNKITGGNMTNVQTFGEVSVESEFQKCD